MDPYIGQIVLFAFNFAPRNFVACDGQLLLIEQNTMLFSVIGTTFGGNGQTTFAVPNYQGKAPAGSQYCICIVGVFPQR